MLCSVISVDAHNPLTLSCLSLTSNAFDLIFFAAVSNLYIRCAVSFVTLLLSSFRFGVSAVLSLTSSFFLFGVFCLISCNLNGNAFGPSFLIRFYFCFLRSCMLELVYSFCLRGKNKVRSRSRTTSKMFICLRKFHSMSLSFASFFFSSIFVLIFFCWFAHSFVWAVFLARACFMTATVCIRMSSNEINERKMIMVRGERAEH